ncbi:MAG: rhodanese-like domain-containing protein [Ignavibacteria bacterium]
MNIIKKVILALILFLNLTVCAQDKTAVMTVSELKDAQKNDKSLVILDVRTPQELKGPLGQIDGVINIPVQELESRIKELEKYKDKNIAVICRSGNRSAVAQKILKEHGYKSRNVSGGMIEYVKSTVKK